MIIPTFDLKNNNHSRLLVFLFVIAILFNLLSRSETSTILSILVLMIGVGVYSSAYFTQNKSIQSEIDTIIEKRMKQNERNATPSTSYYIKSFPVKGLRFLKENEKMLDIAKNLVFLQVFDKGRYDDMLLMMDRLQKIYIYVLVNRYECKQGLNIFTDLRELLLQSLYSFYIVLPMKTKHMYGLDPHGELDTSIKHITHLTRHMITVLENYARRECKAPYLDPTLPTASDPMNSPNAVP